MGANGGISTTRELVPLNIIIYVKTHEQPQDQG